MTPARYTLDVFEYELDEPMALYGVIPMVLSLDSNGQAGGAFWFNPSETFVDVAKDKDSARTHWISESGIVDLMLMPGPSPKDVITQFTQLVRKPCPLSPLMVPPLLFSTIRPCPRTWLMHPTLSGPARQVGTQELPPLFALGYHQCRWNYKDERDVAQVHGNFEEQNFPYDVLWLDIEHTDGKRYFTWDSNLFPDPKAMQVTARVPDALLSEKVLCRRGLLDLRVLRLLLESMHATTPKFRSSGSPFVGLHLCSASHLLPLPRTDSFPRSPGALERAR